MSKAFTWYTARGDVGEHDRSVWPARDHATGVCDPRRTLADAVLDMARTAVRRAERCVSRLVAEGMIENPDLHLNRLSSLLFVLGRYLVARMGQDQIMFAKPGLPD
jgi:cob(I)alamin adenosyltransferase